MNFQIDKFNYVPAKITDLPYNSNIKVSDNVYTCFSHLFCKSISKEIV